MNSLRNAFALAFTFLVALTTLFPSASASTMDFSGLGLSEGTVLTTHLAYPGVAFTGGKLVLPGTPTIGFNGNSSGSGPGGPDNANSGATLTSTVDFGTITILFNAPIKNASVDLVDIEVGSVIEKAEVRVYAVSTGGTPLYTTVVTGGDPGTGDGILKTVPLTGFTGDMTILRIEVQKLAGPIGASQGYAIDNVCYEFAAVNVDERTWGRIKSLYR